MSWIQENKFTSALAGVTLVGSAALLYLSIQQSGEAEKFQADKEKMLTTEAKLKASVPFPNEENMELKQENVRSYRDAAGELQDKLVAFRPESLQDFAPTQFGSHLNNYRSTLNKAFEDSNATVPADFSYGFVKYTSKQPDEKATGELKYQLDAFQWMLSSLAEAGDVELIKVLREDIEAEKNEPKPDNKKGKKGKSKDKSVFEAQKLELAFRGTESQLEAFLESVANGKEYFFAVRNIRVINEKTAAPDANVKFATPAPAAAAGGFGGGFEGGGFFNPGETAAEGAAEGAEEAPAVEEPEADPMEDDTLVLKSILGDEKLNVYLQMELLIFKPQAEVKIPGKGNKSGASGAETEESETE